MAWDFSTEPEFEEKLGWMRAFVRDEVFPLETLDLTYDQVRQVIRPLQDQVKAEGLWAAHLPPALGGMGFGQVKLGLMHEILGQSPLAPVVFGNNAPDSGNAELLAVGIEETGDEAMRAQWLQPLLDGELRSAFSMTEPTPRAPTRRCSRRRPCATATSGSSTATSGSPQTARWRTSSS